MPGFTFPAVGRLGSTSPPYRPVVVHWPSVLWSAKTSKCPSRLCSLFAVRHRYLVCSFTFARRSGWSTPSQRLDFASLADRHPSTGLL